MLNAILGELQAMACQLTGALQINPDTVNMSLEANSSIFNQAKALVESNTPRAETIVRLLPMLIQELRQMGMTPTAQKVQPKLTPFYRTKSGVVVVLSISMVAVIFAIAVIVLALLLSADADMLDSLYLTSY